MSLRDALVAELVAREPALVVGPPGEMGPEGKAGLDGLSIEGPRGPQGETGPEGPQGIPGPEGPEGPRGPKGDKGPQGLKGDKGERGDTGPQGQQGPAGAIRFGGGGRGGGGGPSLSDAVPLIESGAGAAGTAPQSSRDDHVHPAGGGGGSGLPAGGDVGDVVTNTAPGVGEWAPPTGGDQTVYVQPTDPGAVGAGKLWLDTSDPDLFTVVIRFRNGADDAWYDLMEEYRGISAAGLATRDASLTLHRYSADGSIVRNEFKMEAAGDNRLRAMDEAGTILAEMEVSTDGLGSVLHDELGAIRVASEAHPGASDEANATWEWTIKDAGGTDKVKLTLNETGVHLETGGSTGPGLLLSDGTTLTYSTDYITTADADAAYDSLGAAAAAQAASQPLDSDLTAFAGLAIAADKLPYGTGSHTLGLADFTAAGRAILDDADAAAQRTTLGLGTLATQSGTFSGTSSGTNTGDQTVGTIATQNANAVTITGGSITGVSGLGAGAGFFGDGSDGALTLTQTTAAPAWATKAGVGAAITFTLIRDVYATTFDLDDANGNFLVKAGGFRIFASTSLIVDAGVTVQNDGPAGSNAGSAGAANTAGTIASSTGAGGAGGVNAVPAVATAVTGSAATTATAATAHGGTGGAATGGGTGGGAAGGNASNAANLGSPRDISTAYQANRPTGQAYTGGGGGTGGSATGGATATGGGGGTGGSLVMIAAKLLTNSGLIRAVGGVGGNGTAGNGTGSGGGGGGGGGVVILIYGTGSTVGTTSVAGGTGGTPTGTGATGGTGVVGIVYQLPL